MCASKRESLLIDNLLVIIICMDGNTRCWCFTASSVHFS